MSSRLASLLVQEGFISAARMAEAFQRQVIYGGTLDTVILEMGLVEEGILLDSLARAAELPVFEDWPESDAGPLARVLPYSLAERYHAAPILYASGVLRVLVTDPPDRKQLERLAILAGVSLDPWVAPEYRVHQALERAYQVQVPSRFAMLWARLKIKHEGPGVRRRAVGMRPDMTLRTMPAAAPLPPSAPRVQPVEARRTHDVEMVAEPEEDTDPGPARAPTAPIPQAAPDDPTAPYPTAGVPGAEDAGGEDPPIVIVAEESEGEEEVSPASPIPPATAVTATAATGVPKVVEVEQTAVLGERPAEAPVGVAGERSVAHFVGNRPTGAVEGVVRERGSEPSARLPEGPPASEPVPVEMKEGLRLLEESRTRDQVFETLCRMARARFDLAVLYTVHQERAVARLGLGQDWLERRELVGLDLALDQSPPIRVTVVGRSPYLGKLGTDAAMAHVMRSLGREVPSWGALVPVVLRARTVAVIYADAGGRSPDGLRLADIAQAATEAAQALQRIILRSKSGPATQPGNGSGGLSRVAAGSVTFGGATMAAAGGSTGAARSTTPVAGLVSEAAQGALFGAIRPEAAATLFKGRVTSPGQEAGAPEIEEMLAEIAAERPTTSTATTMLLRTGEAGARILAQKLPGPLRTRRNALGGPIAPVGSYGPLLGLVGRFGRVVVPHLVGRLSDPDAETRFYLTLAFTELAFPEAVEGLGARLFDADALVRRAAALALGRFRPSPELHTLVAQLRRDLESRDLQRLRQAVDALGELRDVASTPRFIELLRQDDELVLVSVCRALSTLTKQDFADSRWRWRAWWDTNRSRSRIDWLLAGLEHENPLVRQSASDELEALTNDTYGYHASLPMPLREEARQKWLAWYKTVP